MIPNLSVLLDSFVAANAMAHVGFSVLVMAISALLTGGQLRIALSLVRDEPTGFQAYVHYARLAPSFFVLMLPSLIPALVGFAMADSTTFGQLLLVGSLPATLAAIYLNYRLGLASYALADSPASLSRAVGHSWARTGSNVGKFVSLFVVVAIPNVVVNVLGALASGFSLEVMGAVSLATPLARFLFDVATLPLITLAWAHAYDAGLDTENAPGHPSNE